MDSKKQNTRRLPRWMKMQMPKGESYSKVKNIVAQHKLHTICTSGNCPNIGDCWNRGTATFMILGDICTRSCKFCGVKTGKPLPPDMPLFFNWLPNVGLGLYNHSSAIANATDLIMLFAGLSIYIFYRIKRSKHKK